MSQLPNLHSSAVLLLCQILSCILGTHNSCQEKQDAGCALPPHALPAGSTAKVYW